MITREVRNPHTPLLVDLVMKPLHAQGANHQPDVPKQQRSAKVALEVVPQGNGCSGAALNGGWFPSKAGSEQLEAVYLGLLVVPAAGKRLEYTRIGYACSYSR
jgi:hypothetical protein